MKNNPVQGVCWPGLAWRILRFVQGTTDPPGGRSIYSPKHIGEATKDAKCFKDARPASKGIVFAVVHPIKLAVDKIDAPPINETQRSHLPEENKTFLWHVGLSERVFMNARVRRGR